MKEQDIELLASLQNKNKAGHLKQYTKFFLSDDKTYIMCGECHGDPRWADGTIIRTSVVIHHHEEEKIVETRNSYYTLGEEVPDSDEYRIERIRLLSVL